MEESIRVAVNAARAHVRAEQEIYAEKSTDILEQFEYVLKEHCYFFLEKGCSRGIHIIFTVDKESEKDIIVINIDGPLYGTPTLPRRTWTLSRYSAKVAFGVSPNIDRIASIFVECLKRYNAKDCRHTGWNYQIEEEDFCPEVKGRYEKHLQFLRDNDPEVKRKIREENLLLKEKKS